MQSKSDNSNIIKRVYKSLKCSVISNRFPAGERLNIETLAEDLRVSITPVRESLLRLVAEGLITTVPKMGFFMKTLSEADIRNLYELNHVLVDWSVNCLISDAIPGSVVGVPELCVLRKKLLLLNAPTDEVIATSMGLLFEACAKRSGNSEILLRVENANDRLNYIRICEARMQVKPLDPLLMILKYGSEGSYVDLKAALKTQFELSLRLLPHVMRQGIFPAVSVIEEAAVEIITREPISNGQR
jgi:DNA-binding transcriptional regulator YhcF (GntR family)